MAAKAATPNTAPSWRTVLNVPDALPSAAAGTEFITTFWTAGIAIDVPVPATINARIDELYGRSLDALTAIQPRPAPWSARPAKISGRAPTRSASEPAMGATTNSVAVHG